jgi:hypothetical protein
MPIIGVIDSAKTGNLVTTAFDSIATANGTGSSGVITFSSIPSTYKHLQIRMTSKGSLPYGFPGGIATVFNGDTTTANYYSHNLRADGTAVSASDGSGYTSYFWSSTGSTGTDVYAIGVMDILDYTNNKFKTSRSFLGADYNNTATGMLIHASFLWQNTAAITSITLTSDPTYTGNWTTATSFALYGIKG